MDVCGIIAFIHSHPKTMSPQDIGPQSYLSYPRCRILLFSFPSLPLPYPHLYFDTAPLTSSATPLTLSPASFNFSPASLPPKFQ
jgi:hypothetical protein